MDYMCSKCGDSLPLSAFYKDRTKPYERSSRCIKCTKKDHKKASQTTRFKKRVCSHAKKIRKAKKQKLIESKGGMCAMCGEVCDEVCYDFHHIDPKEKEFPVGQLLRHSDTRLKKEVSKCIMVCANCHRIIHKKMRRDSAI